jgi:hypothetical protein
VVFMACIAPDMVFAEEVALVAATVILLAAVLTLAAAVETVRAAEDAAPVRTTRFAVLAVALVLDVVPFEIVRALVAARLVDTALLRVALVLAFGLLTRRPLTRPLAVPAERRTGRRVMVCRGIDLPP